MNSYEPRLNELKSLTNQLDTDNKELKNDVEAFAQKWFETYALISKLYIYYHFFSFFNLDGLVSRMFFFRAFNHFNYYLDHVFKQQFKKRNGLNYKL